MTTEVLKELIIHSLEHQGFIIDGHRILLPPQLDKQGIRRLHAAAVAHRVDRARRALKRHEDHLLQRIAAGADVVPERISPRLVEVQAGTDDELLFRYASLHWSIPVSSGYGRRLRFLVVDEQNDKLIGLIGLGDPVFALGARDRWIGWDAEARKERLHHVMDAFVLGAVPPYSFLLCGKLVAMLVASNEIKKAFMRKYSKKRLSFIRGRPLDARLVLVTTTSALGRSSLYNRVTYDGRLLYHSVGFTRGSGEFHFSNGLYRAISDYAMQFCQPTAKNEKWGNGFRNRREIVKKCLVDLGLSQDLLYHGIRREVFVVPLAHNAREFLQGKHSKVRWLDQSVEDLFRSFRKRWLLLRAERNQRYRDFNPESWRLWGRKAGEVLQSSGRGEDL
ncbi:MAG: DUF4338 domain-containing protein [Thermoanaerobacterales bacterium]|nr:DUF4338 domain-containing protein [Thermoanaerobacterales bacterium]